MAKQNSINNVQLDVINVQRFSANGTYTPTAGMRYCIVELVGGGGGSGGAVATAAGQVSVSAGGGGAGYVKVLFTAADIGASKAVVIGTGGTAGAAGGAGGAGGDSTFGSTLATATGGNGGGISTAGATASTGIVQGGSFTNGGGTLLVGVGGERAGGSFASVALGLVALGRGGGSVMGIGGPGIIINTAQGNSGPTGAGGASRGNANLASSSANSGSAGSAGLCIVTEFIN